MTAARVIKAIDILKDSTFCLTACVPFVTPDQLSLDRFEERFNHGIVIAITLAAHRDLEAVQLQAFLILV